MTASHEPTIAAPGAEAVATPLAAPAPPRPGKPSRTPSRSAWSTFRSKVRGWFGRAA